MAKKTAIPKYGLHKPSGQACIYINRKRHYLGPWDSPESKEAYSRLITQMALTPAPLTERAIQVL
jgi:hypothetical protein